MFYMLVMKLIKFRVHNYHPDSMIVDCKFLVQFQLGKEINN